MHKMKFEPLPIKLGIKSFKVVEGDSARKIALDWLSIYCPNRTSFKGIRRFKTYLWDGMQCDLRNEKAIEAYDGQIAHEYIIMEDCFGFDHCEIYLTPEKPTGNSVLQDFHVYPKNLAWSMSFTHEDGWIGPLFSKHKFYEKLNRKNVHAYSAVHT